MTLLFAIGCLVAFTGITAVSVYAIIWYFEDIITFLSSLLSLTGSFFKSIYSYFLALISNLDWTIDDTIGVVVFGLTLVFAIVCLVAFTGITAVSVYAIIWYFEDILAFFSSLLSLTGSFFSPIYSYFLALNHDWKAVDMIPGMIILVLTGLFGAIPGTGLIFNFGAGTGALYNGVETG